MKLLPICSAIKQLRQSSKLYTRHTAWQPRERLLVAETPKNVYNAQSRKLSVRQQHHLSLQTLRLWDLILESPWQAIES